MGDDHRPTVGPGNAAPHWVRLDFSSGPDLVGPLTWGQNSMWAPLQWFGDEAYQFNLRQTVVLPRPLSQTRVAGAMRILIERQQVLRSHYVDANDGQGPEQRVSGDGHYEVETVTVPLDKTAGAVSDLTARLMATAFDHASGWPARFGWVLTPDRLVSAIVFVGSHLAFDGWSMARAGGLLNELLTQDPNHGPPLIPEELLPGSWQPLDQTRYERSPVGVQKGETALHHWEQRLATTPVSMFDFPSAPVGELRMERYRFESAAVVAAGSAIAKRTNTSVSNVLLSLTVLILASYNGHGTCTLKLISGNRYDKLSRTLITINAMDGLLTVPVDRSLDLQAAIQQVYRAALGAYQRGQCDPVARDALIERSARRRGASFDLSAYYNDNRNENNWPAVDDQSLTRAELERRRGQSRFWLDTRLGKSDMKFYLTLSDSGTGIARLTLLADTAYLPAPTGEVVLRGIETLLCDALLGEVRVHEIPERIGLVPAQRGSDWVQTARGWLRPHAVAQAVRAAAGGARTAVFARERGDVPGQATLTAYVVAQKGAGTAAEDLPRLHERVLEQLPGWTGAAAPDEYVLCKSGPDSALEPESDTEPAAAAAVDGSAAWAEANEGPESSSPPVGRAQAWLRTVVVARGVGRSADEG